MEYILRLLPAVPFVVVIATIIYFFNYKYIKSKGKRLSKRKGLAIFTFIGWLVMYLYITQIMFFGNNMGERLNIKPLQPLYLAIKYGLENGGMSEQILLNVIMTVPLGFLLPVIFPNKCKNYLVIFYVSFASALLTETVQFLTNRSADIDDIITNTLGGLLGFSMYIFMCGICYAIKERKKGKILNISHYGINLIGSFIIVLITVAPFVTLKIINNSNKLGFVYYGHLAPANVEIPDTISGEENNAEIYKYVEKESIENLKARLVKASGFKGSFANSGNCLVLEDGKNKRIFIYDHNKWAVDYNYGGSESIDVSKGENISIDEMSADNKQSDDVDISKLPKEEEAIILALKYLEQFNIYEDTIEFKEIGNNYGDKNLHLIFNGKSKSSDEVIFGDVTVTLGEDGKLISIDDLRVNCEFYEKVKTISPKESIDISQEVGVGKVNDIAYVEAVVPDFYFNTNTGFLIPTWRITAVRKSSDGQAVPWTANIDARK